MVRISRLATAALAGLPLFLAASNAHAITPTLPTGTTNVKVVSSVDVGNCVIHAGYAQIPTVGPAQYLIFAQREPSGTATCAGAHGYEVLAAGLYGTPDVAIAKGASNQIAVLWDGHATPSGEAPLDVSIVRLSPTTLVTEATAGLAVPPSPVIPGNGPDPSIDVHSAEFTVPGDLLVYGTKGGRFQSTIELTPGDGTNYQATFTAFATATGAEGVSQVLAW